MKNGCTGKVRYPDHERAIDALKTLAVRSGRQKIPHRVYYCNHCKGWHGTSKQNYADKVKGEIST